MDACDVLIVGGGPAGSSCASALRGTGLDVLIVDRATFPREKLCGGWITPLVVDELQIDTTDYASGRTLQPITSFKIGAIGAPPMSVECDKVVSYGIRRCEFDEYLLRRSGARVREGYAVTGVERSGPGWIINGEIRARMLVGAGGHFCPIPRLTSEVSRRQAVVAREIEFEMTDAEAERCGASGETPELYFCRDMRGYGWCFRKGRFLNIGLGRMDPHRLGDHVEDFLKYLKTTRGLRIERQLRFSGHAYFLFGESHREIVADGLLLIGDSAGLAFAQSGEGIRPAVESGLIAADAIVAAEGNFSTAKLRSYERALLKRFGCAHTSAEKFSKYVPIPLRNAVARTLLRTPKFARFVVDEWFLRAGDTRLDLPAAQTKATENVA